VTAVFRFTTSEAFFVKAMSAPPKFAFHAGPMSVAAIRKTPDVAGVDEEEINAEAVTVMDELGSFKRMSEIVITPTIPAPDCCASYLPLTA
jgi:hypothetical protein